MYDNLMIIEGGNSHIHSSASYTYWEKPYQENTDNYTFYYGTSKYVVHVLGGVVSKIFRRLPESRKKRRAITTLSRGQVITAKAA